MADFCKQCAVGLCDFDLEGDLEGLCKPGETILVICEGCGFIQVDHMGYCISPDCSEQHGKQEHTNG